ncbi:MAG: ArsR/SmtB family transcription factor [Nocardioides sp.]
MDVFEALADPVRRDLLAAVAVQPMRVVDLAAAQAVSRPAVSRHLRLLTEVGLVAVEDRGRERHYALCRQPLRVVDEFLAGLAGTGTRVHHGALEALGTEVRRTTRDRRRTTSSASAAQREDTA